MKHTKNPRSEASKVIMAILLIFVVILLMACQLDIEHMVESDIEPIEIRICLDDWLYDKKQEPILDDTGAQLRCTNELP